MTARIISARCLALGLTLMLASGAKADRPVVWNEHSPATFERARAEGKLLILDLHAVWCHWCHVMEERTYKDPRVEAILADHFLALSADGDERLDLAARYDDYGWPATIVYAPDGTEIAKRSGYIPADDMAAMLEAFVRDPTPGPSITTPKVVVAATSNELDGGTRARLLARHLSSYDTEHAGWGRGSHKSVKPWAIEWSVRAGGEQNAAMARATLDAGLRLMDPAWGGIYQYSHGGTWDNPHFEKIMAYQADAIRSYALGFGTFRDQRYLDAAVGIERYLTRFLLSPEGAFYTSQDADLVQGEHSADYFAGDDAARLKLGIPRVDRTTYARDNGLAIEALALLYGVTKDKDTLARAERAARWVLSHRATETGGFRHGERDAAPILIANMAMGRAFLALHDATGLSEWLDRASAVAGYMVKTFVAADAPGVRSVGDLAGSAVLLRHENILAARFANALDRRAPSLAAKSVLKAASRYLNVPDVALSGSIHNLLLLDAELRGALP